MGIATRLPDSVSGAEPFTLKSMTLGAREEQNPYTAELAALADALHSLPGRMAHRVIAIFTSNKAAVLTLRRPQQQSGQREVTRIYEAIQELRCKGNRVKVLWAPPNSEVLSGLARMAKCAAQQSTLPNSSPAKKSYRAKATTLNNARRGQQANRSLPDKGGMFSKRVDAALPGPHTRLLYDPLSYQEARALIQLRTGKARLNFYLAQIGAVPSAECECGQAEETVEHFLFRCQLWTRHRKQLL